MNTWMFVGGIAMQIGGFFGEAAESRSRHGGRNIGPVMMFLCGTLCVAFSPFS